MYGISIYDVMHALIQTVMFDIEVLCAAWCTLLSFPSTAFPAAFSGLEVQVDPLGCHWPPISWGEADAKAQQDLCITLQHFLHSQATVQLVRKVNTSGQRNLALSWPWSVKKKKTSGSLSLVHSCITEPGWHPLKLHAASSHTNETHA